MADETTEAETAEDLRESVSGYAQIVEEQANQIGQQEDALARQNEIIERLDAQVNALREALSEQVEMAVLAKAELTLAERDIERASKIIADLREQVASYQMDDISKDA